jgi:hypothetical protein
MHFRARFSRGLAVASCGALLGGLTLVPAGSASAAVPTEFEVEGSSQAASGCTVTSGTSNVTNGPKVLHHGRAKGAVNLATTWTNGSNSSDITTVTGHYSGNVHMAVHHGAFRSAVLNGSGQVVVSRALGGSSTCNVGATMVDVFAAETQQPKAGWFYVTRKTSKASIAETIIANEVNSSPVVLEIFQGGASSVTQRGFAKPGTYLTELVSGIQGGTRQILLKSGGTVSRTSLTNTMSATFYNAGSAFGSAKGSATKFVRFPGSISCSHHSATLTFKSGASKVAGGAFFVNGKKKATVSNPHSGHRVVLRHLGKTADNTIRAQLSLNGGGSASASRAYVPCAE